MVRSRKTRPDRVLILPGDVHYNLGDTAICAAVVWMIRSLAPDCEICVAGSRPIVDEEFGGVKFHPLTSLRCLAFAARADLVLWGGGQLLQGNRSRLKIPIWFLRILAVRGMGKRILGIGQGLGPLVTASDRRFSRWAIAMTRAFTVRDRESELEAAAAGVPASKIVRTADPAILLPKAIPDFSDAATPRTSNQESEARPRLGISLRFTLHHRAHRIVPFQYLPSTARHRQLESSGYARYLDFMEDVWYEVATKLSVDLMLFPTYLAPWESDLLVAEALASRLAKRGVAAEISHPQRSLAVLLDQMRTLGAFVGTPMHSTILSTATGVPTLALYYEPKGLSYLQSLGLEEWAFPLSRFSQPASRRQLTEKVLDLWDNRDEIRDQLSRSVLDRQDLATRTFERLLAANCDIESPRTR